jgi:hypothetical protein
MRHLCIGRVGGRWNWPAKSKKLVKMRAFIVKCCGRQSCHNNWRPKTTSSQMNATFFRKFVAIGPPNLKTLTYKQQPLVEESSKLIKSTSKNIPRTGKFSKSLLYFIASQIELSEILLTTHISEVVTQDVQTQTGSDPVEAKATYTFT